MLKRLIVLFLLALIPLALLCYAHFIEREWIDKTEYVVESKDWHGEELRLAVLADLHARHPHESMQPAELEKHLRPLTALPCFVVLGNHDYYHDEAEVRGMFARLGIPSVEGQRMELLLLRIKPQADSVQ